MKWPSISKRFHRLWWKKNFDFAYLILLLQYKSYFLSSLANKLLKGLLLIFWNSLNFSSADASLLIDFGKTEFLIGFVCVMNQTYFNNF